MALSRFNKRKLISNTDELYKEEFKKRGVNRITHFNTANLVLDDSLKSYNFNLVERIWKDGDKMHKYSREYYGSVEYWWVIGLFNQKPTDSHFQSGELVLIPYPLEEFLTFIKVY